MTSPSLPVETKPHRRWQFSHFQFSLRTLLIGVTLCALPMAWLGPKIRQAYHEQGAVAWVTKQGGMVIHEEVWFGQWLPGPVQSVSLYNTQATDLTPLQELTNLEWLNLSGIQVSDLTPLKGLANLEELVLSGTQVSDLTPLKDRTNLRLPAGLRFNWEAG